MNKRISFREWDAARMYEWYLALRQGMGGDCCENCATIAKRLAAFIDEPKRLKRLVKKYPYFINGKSVDYGNKD